tara:strand:- start:4 stop:969 length:966 start_codon:yes stop_codon:yes gene_type:complete
MANDKFSGYSSKTKNKPTSTSQKDMGKLLGSTDNNRLDRVNPYEFRKGMDIELASMGVARLKEASMEQREEATEKVLKMLEEHQSYYSALIQFTAGMDQAKPINETSFKEYLKSYSSERGDGMVEVETKLKDDKMAEPKYNKKEYTTPFKGSTEQLKEAIKKEVVKLLKEDDEEKSHKAAEKGAKGKKGIEKKIKKAEERKKILNQKRKEAFTKYSNSPKKQKDVERFKKTVKPLEAEVKTLDKDLEILNNELIGIATEAKLQRREIAKKMMGKDVHLEILEIIKEAGVSLKEGAEGVRMYYEIAKTAYQEGMMAANRDND